MALSVRTAVLVCSLSVASAAQDEGHGWFAAESFENGLAPRAGLAADFNGDGFVDVASGNVTSSDVTILAGNGDGTFETPRSIPVQPGIQQLACGDVNGDGRDDLVALVGSDFGTNPGVAVAFLMPNGTFADPVFTLTTLEISSDQPQVMAVGDVNHDGRMDVLLGGDGGPSGPHGNLLLGTPTGLAIPLPIDLPEDPKVLALADMTGDGRLDLITGHDRSPVSRLFVFTGMGDGTFETLGSLVIEREPRVLQVGDMNMDGHQDVLLGVADDEDDGGHAFVVLAFLGVGNGGLTRQPDLIVGDLPRELFLAKVDDDPFVDVVVGQEPIVGQRVVEVMRGMGDGSFTSVQRIEASASVLIGLGDFDGDDVLDLSSAQTQGTAGVVTVRRGQGDGGFDTSEIVILSSESDPAGGSDQLRILDTSADGRADLILSWRIPPQVSFLEGDGAAGFGPPRRRFLPGIPSGLELVDLDADGLHEAVTTVPSQPGSIWILPGLGSAGFGAPVVASDPSLASGEAYVVGGDMTNDGVVDLVTSDPSDPQAAPTSRVAVWRGNGSLVPGAPVITDAVWRTRQLHVADMNGDGDLDVLRAASGPPKVVVMPGRGDGTFGNQAVHEFSSAGAFWSDFDVADLDDDGDLDVVAGPQFGPDVIWFLPGKGTGGFDPLITHEIYYPMGEIEVIDLDLDGHRDVLGNGVGMIQVVPGLGGGALGETRLYQTYPGLMHRGQGDLDGDLFPDVVTVDQFQPALTVLTSRRSPWTDLGNAKAAPGGTPSLTGGGLAQIGAPYQLAWTGPQNAMAFLVLGASVLEAPFQGGVLVPAPDVVLAAPSSFVLTDTWDDDLPPGLVVALQVWFDAAGVVSATNGVAVVLEG